MKPKNRSKGRKETQPPTNPGSKARNKTKVGPRSGTLASTSRRVPPPTTSNGCEEIEVGDIGGFGDPEELEAHEKRCGEKAREFCNACGRNLCSSHYELLHKDHDTTSGHNTVKPMTTSNQ